MMRNKKLLLVLAVRPCREQIAGRRIGVGIGGGHVQHRLIGDLV